MEPPAGTRRLYRGGAVYSPADPFATAMLVEGSTVAWVGPDEAASAWTREGDEVVDLEGRLVTPAFVDAHVHLTETGLRRTGLDLSAVRSRTELLDAVAARARPGELLAGFGWDESRWPAGDGVPTRAELDRAAGGAPVVLSRVDGHSALVTSALAEAAGLRGLAGWDEDGRVRTAAHHAALDARWAALSPTAAQAARRAALEAAAAAGIGTVHEMSGRWLAPPGDLAALQALSRAEALPDVVGYLAERVEDPEQARAVLAGAAAGGAAVAGLGGDLVVDGALGSRTAALRADYADAPGERGSLHLDAAAVAGHLHACTRAGVQAAFHAIGDAALAVVVEALEAVAADLGVPALASAGHRVEHAVLADADVVAAFARFGTSVSTQPAFDAHWGAPGGLYESRLGPQRRRGAHPFAALAAAGVPLALGSDTPVTPFAPWAAVRAAGFPPDEERAVSVRAAFLAHTRGGHRLAGLGHPGVLRPGAPATYAVWDVADLVVQAPDRRLSGWSTDARSGTPGLPDLGPGAPEPVCRRTVVDGVVVHDDLRGAR
ncbi:amidohydrolase [Kineococcus radiotolerans]|uniref:Amidohydrolase 3 n=1 Tax=Kineococcus radiotolerans (strain ATCC BAA-149 / DSM 14245 / SRS30216) TaxID=266940 RepID=A6W986_KINRD|nr:amidohydrolase family protein [Kineococcus radiotolerans]ABS03375.1 Amidohydrolase 3 [Kineococcus radiotolerans SRS30216 = ATCC BAA-149]